MVPSNVVNIHPNPKQNGYVISQAPKMPLITVRLTALRPLVAPTPIIALLAVWVVLTGSPTFEAASITVAADMLATKPLVGSKRVILVPNVRITFQPPNAVPTPIDIPAASCIQNSTVTSLE